MSSVTLASLSGRHLSFAERDEMAILHARGYGVREIARTVGRPPATISREPRRNAATRSGYLEYRATTAQWHADRRAQCPQAHRKRRAETARARAARRQVVAVAGTPVPGPAPPAARADSRPFTKLWRL